MKNHHLLVIVAALGVSAMLASSAKADNWNPIGWVTTYGVNSLTVENNVTYSDEYGPLAGGCTANAVAPDPWFSRQLNVGTTQIEQWSGPSAIPTVTYVDLTWSVAISAETTTPTDMSYCQVGAGGGGLGPNNGNVQEKSGTSYHQSVTHRSDGTISFSTAYTYTMYLGDADNGDGDGGSGYVSATNAFGLPY